LQKLYYIGPQFRRERPQKGRYRQFYQIGARSSAHRAPASESPSVDAEVLEMLAHSARTASASPDGRSSSTPSAGQRPPKIFQGLAAALKDVVATCALIASAAPLPIAARLLCKVPADQPIIEKLPA